MGKTILRHVGDELIKIAEDTGKKGTEEAKIMVQEGFKIATGLGDLSMTNNAELEQLKKKEKGRGPEIVAIRTMLARESEVKRQMSQETQARKQAQAVQPHQRRVEQAVLPTGKKQFGIPHKKATTFIAPMKPRPSSVETKHAGRD